MFKDFQDAIDEANLLGNRCFGITKTKRGYSVRTGTLIDTPLDKSSKGLMSWTKTNFIPKEKSKRGRPVGSGKKKFNSIDSSDDESYEQTNLMGGSETIDDETNPTDDIQSAVISVDEIEHDGIKYVVTATGDVYDPDTADIVGKYVDGGIVFN